MEPPDFKGSSPDRTRLQLGSAIPVLCTIGSAAINDTKYMPPPKKTKRNIRGDYWGFMSTLIKVMGIGVGSSHLPSHTKSTRPVLVRLPIPGSIER
jgi:hypothetical protein